MSTPSKLSGTVVLDANGYGTCVLSPQGLLFVVGHLTVSTSTSGLIPVANVYHGDVSQSNLVEGTFVGSSDASDTTHELQPGESLTVEWVGGDPGAVAFARATGRTYQSGEWDG